MHHRGRFSSSNLGFSFVEVLLGITIFVLSFALCVSGFQQLVRAESSTRLKARVEKELQSVAEQVRYQTAASFDSMDESDQSRPTSNPAIRVLSTIEAIDPTTRTRKVTLTAFWTERGVGRSKTMVFSLSQMRAKVAGGVIIVQINDVNTGDGIEGVRVSARGQNIDFVSGQTDSTGMLMLQGVFLNALHPEKISLDGAAARAYHDVGTGEAPNSTRSFFRVYSATTQITAPTYLTIPMIASGRLVGRVTDSAGAPVVDAHVHVRVKPGSQDIPYELTAGESLLHTDANGDYTLPRLVSGNYWVYMTGNASRTMAAVAIPDDHFDQNIGNDIFVPQSREKRVDFQTVRRGDVGGTAYAVTGDATGQYWRSDRARNVDIKLLKRQPDETRVSTGGSPFHFTFGHTFAWSMNTTYMGGAIVTGTTNGTGDYQVNGVAPYIVHQDTASYALTSHYGLVGMMTPNTVPDPLLPVLAYAPNGFAASTSDLRFLVSYGTDTYTMRPKNAGDDVFYRNVFSNQTNIVDAFLLDRNVLANIHGQVFNPDGTPFVLNDPTLGEVVVSDYTPDGPANAANVGIFRHDLGRFEQEHAFATTRDGDNHVFFDLKQSGRNALLPNIGGDVTWIKFWSRIGGQKVTQKDVADHVRAWTKVWDGSTISYISMSTPTIDINHVKATCYDYDGKTQWSKVIDIVDGWADFEHKPVHHFTYHLSSAAVSLQPGQDVAVNLTVTPDQDDGFESLFIHLDSPDWVTTRFTRAGATFAYNQALGRYTLLDPQNFPMELKRILTAASVRGTVRDATSGAALAGVTVTLRRTSGGVPDAPPFEPLVTITSPDGRYEFTDVKFVADPNPNIYVQPAIAGYESTPERSSHAYEGINITHDFSLMPLGSGGNGGGL